MPLQKTFTLIPQAPSPAAQSPSAMRPMTSKQVRTAYKAANRMPTLSKAERIKQERAEQERIRKELDKERTAARARAARERKREKETVEREQKKRRGMPLVSVRPSQDTIARFVRGNGSGKKRDCVGRHVADKKAEAIPAPPPPIEEEQEEPHDDRDMAPPEDEFESEMLQDLDMISEEQADENPRDETTPVDEKEASELNPQQNDSGSKIPHELDLIFEEDDFELEMLALDAIATPEQQPGEGAQDDGQKRARRATPYKTDLGLLSTSPRDSHPIKPPDQEPPMPPPPPPSSSPRRRSPSPDSPITPRAQPPPPSTQAILCNLDDFFPTSSQQARELEEETGASTVPEAESQPPAPEPSLPSPPPPSGSPELPQRFFTSSGSNAAYLLAKRQSRRSADLEKLQRNERMRVEAGELIRMSKEAEERRARDARLAWSREKMETRSPMKQPGNRAVETTSAPLMGAKKRSPPIQARKTSLMTPLIQAKKPPGTETNFGRTRLIETKKPPRIHKTPSSIETKTPPPPMKLRNEANKENIPPAAHGVNFPSASQETEYGGDWVDEVAMELMI